MLLLHIGNQAASWTTVNWWAPVAALVVFAVVAAAVWLPLNRPSKRRLQVAALQLGFGLSLLAVLPAVLPIDHLAPVTTAAEGQSDVHAAHCHTDPGSCSDAPVGSGSGQFLTSEPLLAHPTLISTLILLAAPLLVGISRRPLIRPPLAFSAI
jgi:hypothetical protein